MPNRIKLHYRKTKFRTSTGLPLRYLPLKPVFQFFDILISQLLRFCSRAANAGGTHGLVVGQEVVGARCFAPRGLGFKSRWL